MSQPIPALRKTALNGWHRANCGRMGVFAGWELPEDFGGAVDEHLAVRTRAGLIDISPLGKLEVAGRDALAAVQRVTSNDASRLKAGETQSAALTTPAGTLVDQVVVHRLGGSHFLLVVGAAGVGRDLAWVVDQVKACGDVVALDTSARYAGVSIQGPAAADVLHGLTSLVLGDLEPGAFAHGEVAGVRVTLSRAGRTGEDGYELLAPPQAAPKLWTAILQEGGPDEVVPVGLLAQETLRLEAGVRLIGTDIDETTSVLEAGLEDLVAWDKGAFLGREALAAEQAGGVARRVVGFEMLDPIVAVCGRPALVGGVEVGVVTSGAETPFLRKPIGFVRLPASHAAPGTPFEVDVECRLARARVVTLPFYHRSER
jgi:aminomethyltransferase